MTPSEAFVETMASHGVTRIAAAYWAHTPVALVSPGGVEAEIIDGRPQTPGTITLWHSLHS